MEESSALNASHKSPITVLIIHPKTSLVDDCRGILEKHGYRVESARNGNEGVEKIYELIPELILCGTSVPELNGYQLCRLVKNDPITKRIPMMLISEVDEKMDRFWSIKAGADEFLFGDEVKANLLKKAGMLLEIYERIGLREKKKLRDNHQGNPFNIRTRLNQIMDASLVESTLMVEFRGLSDLVHDYSLLNYMLFNLLESIIEYDAAAIYYNDENKGPRVLTFHLPEGKTQPSTEIEKLTDDFFTAIQSKAPAAGRYEILESEVVGVLDNEASPTAYKTSYVKEIHQDGKLIGAFVLYSAQKVHFPDIFPVHVIEGELRLLMKLRHLYSQAEMLAMTDSLTGLFNHRHFMMTLQREFKSSRRYELDLSLALICVDGFKRLNEEFGHDCGDEILKHVAKIAETSFRSVDIPARFAGNNLVVIFPKTPDDHAMIALERFKSRVAETPLVWNDVPQPITISVGLVPIRQEVETLSQLIKQAENALTEARRHGGNRIEISSAKY